MLENNDRQLTVNQQIIGFVELYFAEDEQSDLTDHKFEKRILSGAITPKIALELAIAKILELENSSQFHQTFWNRAILLPSTNSSCQFL